MRNTFRKSSFSQSISLGNPSKFPQNFANYGKQNSNNSPSTIPGVTQHIRGLYIATRSEGHCVTHFINRNKSLPICRLRSKNGFT